MARAVNNLVERMRADSTTRNSSRYRTCAAFVAVVDPYRWRWRFSLRTLLIVMTLVAVVLGLIVYAVKSPAP